MLFCSPTNTAVKSTQQLVVFCYGGERTLLPVPETYEDALVAAQNEFSLKSRLCFHTFDLPGWEGQRVKIHSQAWRGICTILRSITVAEIVKDEDVHWQDLGTSVPEMPTTSRRISTRVIPRKSVLPQELMSLREGHEAMVHKVKDEVSEAEEYEEEEDELVEDGLAEEQNQSSSSILPPSDEEGEKETKPAIPRSTMSLKTPNQMPSSARAETKTPRPKQPQSLYENVGKTPKTSRKDDPVNSLVEQTRTINLFSSPASEENTVNIETEKPFRTEPVRQELSRPQAKLQSEQASGDDRFLISIEYDEDEDSRSLFKTRGKHSVGKVLMQACRTFNISHEYDRAHMILVIETEEDGQITESKFLCDRNDSMAKAGAQENSRFIVRLTKDEN